MLRLTEIKLPLDHGPEAISAAVLRRLRIPANELVSVAVFKRAHDARKKSAIVFIYSLDVMVRNQAEVLKRSAGDAHVRLAPDMAYRFVARAPEHIKHRPIVIGAGPC